MSKNIMILTGSSRPKSAGDKVVPVIVSSIEAEGAEANVVDVRELGLPFFNEEVVPATENFTPINEKAKQLQSMVREADGIILLVSEHNNQMSAIQKNAIDWLYDDWKGKPFSVVGYSWSGIEPVLDQIDRLLKKVGGDYKQVAAQLYFTKDIDLEGILIDEAAAQEKILNAVKAVTKA